MFISFLYFFEMDQTRLSCLNKNLNNQFCYLKAVFILYNDND